MPKMRNIIDDVKGKYEVLYLPKVIVWNKVTICIIECLYTCRNWSVMFTKGYNMN